MSLPDLIASSKRAKIETNNGRHAQGWLALAEIEEAEGNVEEALELCEMSIVEYEKGLVEARKNYKKGLKWTEKFQKVRNLSNQKYDSSNFKHYNDGWTKWPIMDLDEYIKKKNL